MRPSPLEPVRSVRTLATDVPTPAASGMVLPEPSVWVGSSCQIEAIVIRTTSPSGSTTPLMVMSTNLWLGGQRACDGAPMRHEGARLVLTDHVNVFVADRPLRVSVATTVTVDIPTAVGVPLMVPSAA